MIGNLSFPYPINPVPTVRIPGVNSNVSIAIPVRILVTGNNITMLLPTQ